MNDRALEQIGFYTLSNDRCKESSIDSPMMRTELLITDRCNFRCPYCRGMREECRGDMSLDKALKTIEFWTDDDLKNIRFSGGEPTLHKGLMEMVRYAKERGVERIALSTNGSAKTELYDELVDAGVNDFSISLDACCSTYADKMAGVDGQFQKIIDNIKHLSEKTYVTVGVVFTEETVDSIVEVIQLANDLGVSDIRIISAAQESEIYFKFSESVSVFGTGFRKRYPILAYRLENIEESVPVRGLTENDSHRCGLMTDDSMVAGDWHFPCIIHFREGGEPVGEVGPNMRQERIDWLNNHDTHKDPICRANCLDVCVAYNNKFKIFRED